MGTLNNSIIKALVNRPGNLKTTKQSNIQYTMLSVGVPKWNKSQQTTEYSNILVKVWKEDAQRLCAQDAKGVYIFSGTLESFPVSGADGRSSNVTYLNAMTVEKIVLSPRKQQQQPQQQTAPVGQPATVTPPPQNYQQPQQNQQYGFDGLPF